MEYSGTMDNSKTLMERLHELNVYTKAYIFLFFVFSLQLVPNDIVVALCVIVFMAANLETGVYLYMFSLPWMYVGKFSFGLTISLINTVLLFLKIAIEKKKLSFSNLELLTLAYLTIIGLTALILHSTLTGISIVLYFFISIYIYHTYASGKEHCDDFWGKCLFVVMISTAICIIYGFRADTAIDRWIPEIGNVKQLYGTMGTSRFGLYLNMSILYPLYYVRNKTLKIILCVLFSLAVFGTVSMTSLIMLIFILGFYVLTTGKLSVQKVGAIIGAVVVVALLFAFWDQIGNTDILKPLYTRTNLVIDQIRDGDLDTATTGRISRSEDYTDHFESFGFFNELVGGAILSAAESGYSHNSYLDMLNYCGILGAILLAILQLQHIRAYIRTPVRNQAILVKMLFIIVAATVSIFSSQYWLLFFFM